MEAENMNHVLKKIVNNEDNLQSHRLEDFNSLEELVSSIYKFIIE